MRRDIRIVELHILVAVATDGKCGSCAAADRHGALLELLAIRRIHLDRHGTLRCTRKACHPVAIPRADLHNRFPGDVPRDGRVNGLLLGFAAGAAAVGLAFTWVLGKKF